MKYSRIALLALFLFLSAVATSAQAEKGEWKPPKHSGKINLEYDRAKDQTALSLELMPVTCFRNGCVFISLRSTFSGTKLKAPVDRILFGLSIVTKKLEPFSDPKLTFRLDGELMEIGEMTFAGKVPADELYGLPYGIILRGNELSKIADAHKVVLQMGPLELALSEEVLNAIKDYDHQAQTVQRSLPVELSL